MKIPYEDLSRVNQPFVEDFEKSFTKILKKVWFILGESVSQFEDEYSRYLGCKESIGVANGLDALLLSLKALELPERSEVIVPSNTYIATILAILQAGHVPVLVEPDIGTYNIDPSKIEEKISSKTRAIMVVHLYGKACNMAPIVEICNRKNLVLIEDCAQSHGAKFQNQSVGTFGIGAFSFYPTKNLGALGDAGALTTNDHGLAKKFRTLRNYGSQIKYYNELIGYNSRLDEVQAAFLSIKLRALDSINLHKRKLAEIYGQLLPENVIRPIQEDAYFDVFHIYPIRTQRRNELRLFLKSQGIGTDIHYPVAPHQQKAMQGILTGEYPIAEEIHQTVLSLPISTCHTETDIQKVCEAVHLFFGKK